MFYNNFDQVYGEDRWGMVGRLVIPFAKIVV